MLTRLFRKKHKPVKQPRVLIVDDSHIMRMVIIMTLQDAGFNVVEAENGKQGLHLAKQTDFDLVITDIRMPVMDGLQLIRRLRKQRHYRKTPILSLTNLNSAHFKEGLRLAGANGWVHKPFGRESLLRTINTLLQAA